MRNRKKQNKSPIVVVLLMVVALIGSGVAYVTIPSQPMSYDAGLDTAAMKQAAERQKASTEAQIGLIQYCAQKGGVPIVLYAGTPDVRLSDCKFPFPIQ
jgi:hypothetical protein